MIRKSDPLRKRAVDGNTIYTEGTMMANGSQREGRLIMKAVDNKLVDG